MISRIAAAGEQQSSTGEQIAKNVSAISQVTAESSKRVLEIAHSSEDLAKLTEHLRDLVNSFKVEATVGKLDGMTARHGARRIQAPTTKHLPGRS